MDEAKWERTIMQGHSSANPNWFPRPKLEIPNIDPTTPRRQGTTAQSPRGIYDFPISPQSPIEGVLLSPPMKPTPMKTIPRSLWVAQENYIDLVPNCAQFSLNSNHPGHGFGDCNPECSSNNSSGSNIHKSLDHKPYLSPPLKYGDNVLVRCNQTKWLVGQVRRISSSSIKVWIGVAETLVNIPMELFPTHIARMECTTQCSSPIDYYTTRLHHTQQQIKTQVHCVRPAHLSHRRLFHIIPPNNSITNSIQQMCQVQCPSPTSTNPRINYERNSHCFAPVSVPNPPNSSAYIAYLEKKGIIPPKRSILKQTRNSLELLNIQREESHPQEVPSDGQIEFANQQAQYNWRLLMAQRNQERNRPSYPRPSTLPMLNVNLNEGTPRSNSPFLQRKSYNNYQHVETSPHKSHEQPFYINQEPPMHASYEELLKYTSCKPHYEQFVTSQMVTKSTMTNLQETKSPKRPPTPPPQSLMKGMMDLRDSKSPQRPPTPSHIKGKETCEDQACPSWAKGTDFCQISESNQGMSLERSVSLDSFKSPSFPGLVNPRSPGARLPINATTSAAPVWVTVIDNGHGTQKL